MIAPEPDDVDATRRALSQLSGRPEPTGGGIVARLQRWAGARPAPLATGVWAMMQSTFIPGPVALFLVPLALARPSRAWLLALATLVGAVLGAGVAYALGATSFAAIEPLLGRLGVTPAAIASAEGAFERRGWIVIVTGSFLPALSTKVVSFAAGAADYPFVSFIALITAVRAAQIGFIVVALRFARPQLARLFLRRGLPAR